MQSDDQEKNYSEMKFVSNSSCEQKLVHEIGTGQNFTMFQMEFNKNISLYQIDPSRVGGFWTVPGFYRGIYR